MNQPPALPTDPTAQVEETAAAAVAAMRDVQPQHLDHFADHIPRSQWQRATWLNTPDPFVITLLMDTATGFAVMGLGAVAVAGMFSAPLAVLYLVFVASTLAGAIARAWSYSRRVWPTMYRLAHPHALPPIDQGRVAKRWIPGQARCRAYLDGRLP
jgi:hypothetical protein